MKIKIDSPVNKKSKLGTPPHADDPKITNLNKHPSCKLVPMNFYVPIDFKRMLL